MFMDQVTTVQEPTTTTEPSNPQPDINKVLGDTLWGVKPDVSPQQPEPPAPSPAPPADSTPAPPPAPADEVETVDVDEYFKNNFGVAPDELKEKWNKWKDYDTNPPAPSQQEIEWANEESKRVFELLKEGKRDDVWRFLDQQRQIERLENLSISTAQEAEEIIKTNLRFKHVDLKPEQINRLFERQYAMPAKPSQGDLLDEEYAKEIELWQQQVKQREEDMMIDASIAKPEISKYKSNIVLPDIPSNQTPAQPVIDQKVLDQQKTARDNYLAAVNSNYQNFKGFSITAKDGDVELPISYLVTTEEQISSKQSLENFDINEYFNKRWFDENGNPKITLIQEDLYELENRDKIHQKIANEASAQRYLHDLKKRNNINVNGVTKAPPPQTDVDTRSDSEKLADAMWSRKQ